MAQQICETNRDEDQERRQALGEFFRIYGKLSRRRALRWRGYTDGKSALIEVREYKNSGKRETICRVKVENETDCYRIAAQQLKWELEKTAVLPAKKVKMPPAAESP